MACEHGHSPQIGRGPGTPIVCAGCGARATWGKPPEVQQQFGWPRPPRRRRVPPYTGMRDGYEYDSSDQ